MGIKKCTTERFVEKSIEKHGDRYDYSKVIYKGVREKVTITCKIHGDFKQTPESHLTPRGCFKCGYKDYRRAFTYDKQNFIEKCNAIYNFKYKYNFVDFVDIEKEIIIICDVHGEFTQKPKNHLKRGCRACVKDKLKFYYDEKYPKIEKESVIINCSVHGEFSQFILEYGDINVCRKCKNKGEFNYKNIKVKETIIRKLIEIHKDYDFSNTVYVKSNEKITYICKYHGEKQAYPNNLLKGSGCKECSLNKPRFDRVKWINRLNSIHNFTYDYSKVSDSPTYNKKEIIICSNHGEFIQATGSHSMGVGCPKCGLEKVSKINSENPMGWSYSSWEEQSLKSKYFESFKVYIIRCWNDSEEFYKIGKTFLSTKRRFQSKHEMPYNWEVVKEIESQTGRIICEL